MRSHFSVKPQKGSFISGFGISNFAFSERNNDFLVKKMFINIMFEWY